MEIPREESLKKEESLKGNEDLGIRQRKTARDKEGGEPGKTQKVGEERVSQT